MTHLEVQSHIGEREAESERRKERERDGERETERETGGKYRKRQGSNDRVESNREEARRQRDGEIEGES